MTRKMLAAQEALRRWGRPTAEQFDKVPALVLPKTAAAREALRRLTQPQALSCTAKIDRLVLGCADIYMTALLGLEGYSREKSHWLKPRNATDFIAYGRVTKLVNKRNGAQILVYSERKSRKLDPYRITFIPNDRLGLQPEDVLAVAECMEGHRIVLAEMALDFTVDSGVDCAFVRGHGLFGKCREHSVGKRPGWDAWGSRRGAKFVRSYFKAEVDGHRVEAQVQTRFLRDHRINEISDLPRLAKILPRDHVWFARLSEEKFSEALRHSGLEPSKGREILDGARARNEPVGDVTVLAPACRLEERSEIIGSPCSQPRRAQSVRRMGCAVAGGDAAVAGDAVEVDRPGKHHPFGGDEVEKEKNMAKGDDGYFGLCPVCKETDGYLSVGRNHWFVCEKHRVRWWIGENVFSSWRDETESEQQRHCEEIGFDTFTDVEPFYPEIEGVERLESEGRNGKRPTVPSKPASIQPIMVRRHRRKKRD